MNFFLLLFITAVSRFYFVIVIFTFARGANKVSALNPSSSLQNRELRDVEKFKNFIPDGIVKSDVAGGDYDKEEVEYGGMSHSKEKNQDRQDSREGSPSSDVGAIDVISNVTNINNISNKKNNVFDQNNIGSENINNDNTNYNNDFTNNNIARFNDNNRSNSNNSTMVNNNNLINNNNTVSESSDTVNAKVGELEISSTTTTTLTTIPPSLSSATTTSAALETSSSTLLSTTASTEATTSTTTSMPWSVSAGNTTILRHPNNNITLYASISVHGVNVSADDYKFQWMMVSSSPPNHQTGQMIDMSTSSLKLFTLQVGNYTFKVTAMKGQDAREALVHVVVLPPVRLNKAPVVTVMPSEQKLSQLNDLVIDGSGSSDDDRIVSYKWDLISGPITSFPVDEGEATFTSPTLKLKGGLAPGFYKLKLTVTDSDGVSSAAYANVTVIKEVDYPPKANAGNNIIVNLPINSVTLNGNMSSDDKRIVSYEWTKVSDELVTDMVGVRTPYLALGNLQVGDYTFKLTVKDQSNQTDQADVHVIVKPAQNQAPVANAGLNQTVVLPVDLVVLNASNSTDDKKIISYQWIVISGPPGDTKIGNSNQSVARLLSPRLGVYVLQVKVTDEEHLYSVASSVVTVKQNPNAPPVANAGGDFAVDIQTGMLVKINGSKSRDDRGIVSYFWQKGQNNPAVGEVVPGSDHSPILLLINLVPGLYTFTLKVVDVEGLVDTDDMVLTVNKDIKQDYMVDVVLGVDVDKFTDVDKNALKLHLEMMFPSMLANVTSCKVIFHKVTSELDTNRVFLQMYVQTSDKKLSKNSDASPHGINSDEDDGDVNDRNIGKGMEWKMRDSDEIVRVMKMKYTEGYILEFPLVRILPVVCHSACSGHGKCDQVTKLCQCDTFWTPNWLRAHYGIQESNCEWSLLYVVIVIVVIVVVVVTLIWCVVCAVRRRFFRKDFKAGKAQSSLKRRHRYKLLEETHNGVGPAASGAHLNGTLNQTHPTKLRVSRSVVSDSDTSSEETVFINNNKLNTNNVNNNKSSVNSADHIIQANGNQDIGGAVNSDDDNDDDDDDDDNDLFNVVGIDDDDNDGDNEKRPLNKKDGDDFQADRVAKKSTNLISSKTALKNLISLQQLNKRALSTTFQQHRNNWLENQQKQMQLKDQQQRQSQQIQHQLQQQHTSHQLQSQQQPTLQQPTPQQQQQQPTLQQQQPTLQQQQPSLQQQRPFTDFQQQHLHHQQSLLLNTPHTTSDTSVVNLLAT